MASHITRAERAGNIFFRVTGLIRSGQMTWSDRPLWYDVYVAHPPLIAPDWNAQLHKYEEPIKSIFYEEDVIRAQFYKKYRGIGHINMEQEGDSMSQKFVNEYNEVKKEGATANETFSKTEKILEDLGVSLKRPVKVNSS